MRRLVFTHAAQSNLIDIGNYVQDSSGSPETARRFTDDLVAKCEQLAALPGVLGRVRPELLPDLRSTPHGSYVIYFRYVSDTLEIVNILERHRDVGAHFKGSQ